MFLLVQDGVITFSAFLVGNFLFPRECGLAHKTVLFVLDEFDLFAQVMLSCKKDTKNTHLENEFIFTGCNISFFRANNDCCIVY